MAGRIRNRGAVLLAIGAWPGSDVELQVSKPRWHGLTRDDFGRLKVRNVVATSRGRGAAARQRQIPLQLPGLSESVAASESAVARGLAEVAG